MGLALAAAVTPADWRSAPTSRTGSVVEPPAVDLTTTFNGGEGSTADSVPSASKSPPGTAVRVTPVATLLRAATVNVLVARSYLAEVTSIRSVTCDVQLVPSVSFLATTSTGAVPGTSTLA